MIGLVTDSNSQIPPSLAERFAVEVVPIAIEIDGQTWHEGIDLDADLFWSFFADGATPSVTTSQPSPGLFAATYRRLRDRGCTEIISIHVGSAFSGTLNSARLGAIEADMAVHLVDSETMSFGISCCVWAAGSAIAAGATADAAIEAAQRTAQLVRSTFIVQAMDFARTGGRWQRHLPDHVDAASVMTAGPGDAFAVAGQGRSVDELCDLMAAQMHADGAPIRAAVCIADRTVEPFWSGLESRLQQRADVIDIVRYRVGPSVGAHTGPGTAGGFWYPVSGSAAGW